MIVLLDLNYTLVANSPARYTRPRPAFSIARETYRQELLNKLMSEGHRIFLVTARPAHLATETLASIREKTGWRPERSYFNARGLRPDFHKAAVADELLVESSDAKLYLAIESNPLSRAKYEARGIRAITWETYMGEA